MKIDSINRKKTAGIVAAAVSAITILACSACSSDIQQAYNLSTEDVYFQSQLTEKLTDKYPYEDLSVNMIKSAQNDDVIVNIFLDGTEFKTRKGQDEFFTEAFKTVKEEDKYNTVEALHINYADGEERILSIYDLYDFKGATDSNLAEKVTIMNLNAE